MQVCCLYAGKDRSDSSLDAVVKALAKGLEEQGHSVDILNMYTDGDRKLSFYDYIVVGCNTTSGLGGKIPEVVRTTLSRAGQISGKRCFAFVVKGGLRSQKTLSLLMKAMEGEGMYLKFSDVLKKPDVAYALGKRLNVERNL